MSAMVDAVLTGRTVCICAGPGGVGKTTTAAAIAVGMAARGSRVAVLTIDPARRLADSLGLEELDNEPRLVDAGGLDGEVWALMLDAKATFDSLVEAYSPDAESRDRVLGNRVYGQISGALAGSQEYMAMEKLYELDRSGEYDLIVLDTPPSRNALDFLDAPRRVTQFIEGRAMRLFIRPTGFGARVTGRGLAVVTSVLRRVTGGDLIADLSEFFAAMAGLLGGFRERAEKVERLLRDPETTFVVVTGPADEPIAEASHLRSKLDEGEMALGAVIVNRVHPPVTSAGPPASLDPDLADRVRAAAVARSALAERDAAAVRRLEAMAGPVPVIEVPELSDEIHDVEGLLALGRHLFATD